MNELLKIVYLLIVWVHLGRSVYQQVDVDDVRYSADEDQDQNSEVNIFQEFVVPEVELEVPCEFSFDGGRVCDCNFSSKVSTKFYTTQPNSATPPQVFYYICMCTLNVCKQRVRLDQIK